MKPGTKLVILNRTCDEPGCIQPAADVYRKRFICNDHLNPEIPKKDASEVVLVRSNWLPFDEEDPVRPGEAYDSRKSRADRRRKR
jgi:hypothetical protein